MIGQVHAGQQMNPLPWLIGVDDVVEPPVDQPHAVGSAPAPVRQSGDVL